MFDEEILESFLLKSDPHIEALIGHPLDLMLEGEACFFIKADNPKGLDHLTKLLAKINKQAKAQGIFRHNEIVITIRRRRK